MQLHLISFFMWQLIVALIIPFIWVIIDCWKEESDWRWTILYAMVILGVAGPIAIIQRRTRLEKTE